MQTILVIFVILFYCACFDFALVIQFPLRAVIRYKVFIRWFVVIIILLTAQYHKDVEANLFKEKWCVNPEWTEIIASVPDK